MFSVVPTICFGFQVSLTSPCPASHGCVSPTSYSLLLVAHSSFSWWVCSVTRPVLPSTVAWKTRSSPTGWSSLWCPCSSACSSTPLQVGVSAGPLPWTSYTLGSLFGPTRWPKLCFVKHLLRFLCSKELQVCHKARAPFSGRQMVHEA